MDLNRQDFVGVEKLEQQRKSAEGEPRFSQQPRAKALDELRERATVQRAAHYPAGMLLLVADQPRFGNRPAGRHAWKPVRQAPPAPPVGLKDRRELQRRELVHSLSLRRVAS